MDKYQVIFHLDESGKGRSQEVLANITNLLNDLGDERVEVELLANGSGVRLLTKEGNDFSEQIQALVKRGVQFTACQNSMNHFQIQRSDLLDPVVVVPAGVSELVKKQAAGWAYIRP